MELGFIVPKPALFATHVQVLCCLIVQKVADYFINNLSENIICNKSSALRLLYF